MGQDKAKFIWSRGLRFPVESTPLTAKRRAALRDGFYEHKEFNALRALCQPEDMVLELGGGIGFLSAAMLLKFGVRGVHVVEANPALIPVIKAVHKDNGVSGATIENAVAMARAGPDVAFHLRGDFVASSTDPGAGGKIVRTETVPRCVLGEMLDRIKPTLLACDIEGAEGELFDGANLSGLRAAVVELHPKIIGQVGIAAVFEAMHGNGLVYSSQLSQGKVVVFHR